MVWPTRKHTASVRRGCVVGQGRYRPYVENYTVDASILELKVVKTFGSIDQTSRKRYRSLVAADAHAARCEWTLPIDSNSCSQVSKSKRWMPWHLEPKKDVAICDKPRLADKQAFDPRISEWGNPVRHFV